MSGIVCLNTNPFATFTQQLDANTKHVLTRILTVPPPTTNDNNPPPSDEQNSPLKYCTKFLINENAISLPLDEDTDCIVNSAASNLEGILEFRKSLLQTHNSLECASDTQFRMCQDITKHRFSAEDEKKRASEIYEKQLQIINAVLQQEQALAHTHRERLLEAVIDCKSKSDSRLQQLQNDMNKLSKEIQASHNMHNTRETHHLKTKLVLQRFNHSMTIACGSLISGRGGGQDDDNNNTEIVRRKISSVLKRTGSHRGFDELGEIEFSQLFAACFQTTNSGCGSSRSEEADHYHYCWLYIIKVAEAVVRRLSADEDIIIVATTEVINKDDDENSSSSSDSEEEDFEEVIIPDINNEESTTTGLSSSSSSSSIIVSGGDGDTHIIQAAAPMEWIPSPPTPPVLHTMQLTEEELQLILKLRSQASAAHR